MGKMNSYRNDILQIFDSSLPWEQLSGCNILITGSTGLIGGCLVESLMINPLQIDYHVYALGRNEERARKLFRDYWDCHNFHFVKQDVTLPIVSNVSFDFIIHAASGASPNEFSRRPVEVVKSNVNGVANLMEYGVKHGLKRFLFVSSGEVYGEGDGRVFTEDYSGFVDCTSPRSCYPSSKRAAETLCVSYSSEYGVESVIARPCHIYGPYFTENDNRVYAQFLRNVLKGEDIVMKSSGEQFRSWCYVVDCISAIFHILLKGKDRQAYNIADPESNISIHEFANIIAELGGKKVVIDQASIEEKKGYSRISKAVFSILKLESLGWKPKIHVKDGVKRTYEELIKTM